MNFGPTKFNTEAANFILMEWQSAAFRKNVSLRVIREKSYHISPTALCKKFGMNMRLRKAMENFDALQMVRDSCF